MHLKTIFLGLKIFTISNQAPNRVAIEISLSANEIAMLWDSLYQITATFDTTSLSRD